jgi:hypothetical protein
MSQKIRNEIFYLPGMNVAYDNIISYRFDVSTLSLRGRV